MGGWGGEEEGAAGAGPTRAPSLQPKASRHFGGGDPKPKLDPDAPAIVLSGSDDDAAPKRESAPSAAPAPAATSDDDVSGGPSPAPRPAGRGRGKRAAPSASPAAKKRPKSAAGRGRAPSAPPPADAYKAPGAETAMAAVAAAIAALPPYVRPPRDPAAPLAPASRADDAPPLAGIKPPPPTGHPDALTGLAFVISGVLESLTRPAAEAYIKRHGGRVTTSASGKTDVVVLGTGAGMSKVGKVLDNAELAAAAPAMLAAAAPALAAAKALRDAAVPKAVQQAVARARAAKNKGEKDVAEPDLSPQQAAALAAYAVADADMRAAQAASRVKVTAVVDEDGLVALVVAGGPPPPPDESDEVAAAAPDPAAAGAGGASGSGAPARAPARAPAPPRAPARAAAAAPSAPASSSLWVDTYRPSRASDLVGNPGAVNTLRQWLTTW